MSHELSKPDELAPLKSVMNAAVLVAALGYFVDVFDLVLFSVVRTSSLTSLGLQGEELTSSGVMLLNMQMTGMLIGGVLFGILGDKRGRLSVLFGSILLYSLANIANGFVHSIEMYALLRFIAGLGLAGELGGGITLVSEMMPKETRGYATTLIASVGVSGALGAAFVGELFDWRISFVIGGVLGLLLLFLRVAVSESGMFDEVRSKDHIVKGDLRMILFSKQRLLRYLSCIAIGFPIWYAVAIVVTFCPEIGKDLELSGGLRVATAVISYSIGITLGDLASGILSQVIGSRRRVILYFLVLALCSIGLILNARNATPEYYYSLLVVMGFGIGYWAVFVTSAAEQFGTNLRATVATTVPNVVRGSTVVATSVFSALKGSFGAANAAQIVGVIWFALAFFALGHLKETFGRDLDFVEE